MVHEQKFKDPLISTDQVSSERRVLDLESDVPGSILTRGDILSLEFFCFLAVKVLMTTMTFMPTLCVCEKPEWLI